MYIHLNGATLRPGFNTVVNIAQGPGVVLSYGESDPAQATGSPGSTRHGLNITVSVDPEYINRCIKAFFNNTSLCQTSVVNIHIQSESLIEKFVYKKTEEAARQIFDQIIEEKMRSVITEPVVVVEKVTEPVPPPEFSEYEQQPSVV